MKNLKLLALSIAIFTNSFAFAGKSPVEPNDALRAEVSDLIGPTYFGDYESEEFAFDLVFTVNSDHELIVLSVDSENKKVRSYFKRRLNYKKVDYLPSVPGQIFLLPVKIVMP